MWILFVVCCFCWYKSNSWNPICKPCWSAHSTAITQRWWVFIERLKAVDDDVVVFFTVLKHCVQSRNVCIVQSKALKQIVFHDCLKLQFWAIYHKRQETSGKGEIMQHDIASVSMWCWVTVISSLFWHSLFLTCHVAYKNSQMLQFCTLTFGIYVRFFIVNFWWISIIVTLFIEH